VTFAQSPFVDGRKNRKKKKKCSLFIYYFNITNFSKTPHSPPAARVGDNEQKALLHNKSSDLRSTANTRRFSFGRLYYTVTDNNRIIRFVFFLHLCIYYICIWTIISARNRKSNEPERS
jgi:hypothetical protein